MDMDAGTVTAITAAAAAVSTPLAAAIKILWVKVNSQHENVISALKECKEEHKAATVRYDEINNKVLTLAQQVAGFQGRADERAEALRLARENEDRRFKNLNDRIDKSDSLKS